MGLRLSRRPTALLLTLAMVATTLVLVPPSPTSAAVGDIDDDGVLDVNDLDTDGDGIRDIHESIEDFTYLSWTSFGANSATGTINGINFTYTVDVPLITSPSLFNGANFPAQYAVPVNQAAIRNEQASTNTVTFDQPALNPMAIFSSVGSPGTPVGVAFDRPINILWSQAVSNVTATGFTGNEGMVIVQIPGEHTSFSFDYLADEVYANFTFGADPRAATDTDGDGLSDHEDLDSDNDGITDNVEAQSTAGYVAPAEADGDSDGLDNAYEPAGLTPVDTDGDTIPDYLDDDSDGDGTLDIAERGDGQATSITATTDTDNDGLYDIFEAGSPSDGYDPNDDNRTATTIALGGDHLLLADGSNASPPGRDSYFRDSVTDTDADDDGITDRFETGPGGADAPANGDGDANADVYDTDSDGDGVTDAVEYGVDVSAVDFTADADDDHIPDALDVDLTGGDDADTDGIDDAFAPIDTDGDGTADFRDGDSDDDGNEDSLDPNRLAATAIVDLASTVQGLAVTTNVVANDDFVGGPSTTLTVSAVIGDGAAVADAGAGTITYTPTAGETGDATITYQVCNSATSVCADGALVVTVDPPGPACTLTGVNGDTHWVDTGDGITGQYLGYRVADLTTGGLGDVWVKIDSIVGSLVIPAGSTDTYQIGPIGASGSEMAYLFLDAPGGEDRTTQTWTVTAYDRDPTLAGATQLCSATDSYVNVTNDPDIGGVLEDIEARANKVHHVELTAAEPVELGAEMTMTVTGFTGTIGDGQGLDGGYTPTPAAYATWPAGSLQLESVAITFYQRNTTTVLGTFTDQLYIEGLRTLLGTTAADYVIEYTFKATGVTDGDSRVAPIQHITSGTQTKHTSQYNFEDFDAFPPIEPAVNLLSLTHSADVTDHSGAAATAGLAISTHTITVTNGGANDATMSDLVATLPIDASYVYGSTTIAGTASGDPDGAGGSPSTPTTLTWNADLVVPAGGTLLVTFKARYHTVETIYPVPVNGHVTAEVIDTTETTDDDSPAVEVIRVGSLPLPPVAVNDEYSVNEGDGSATLGPSPAANDTSGTSFTVSALDDGVTLGTASFSGLDFFYGPTADFNHLSVGESATDTFAYTIDNGSGTSTATVVINVLGVNDDPVAVDDTATIGIAAPPTPIDVLANDTDPDDADSLVPDDVLTVTSVDTTGTDGTVTVTPEGSLDGVVHYEPSGNPVGTDTFTYTVGDQHGGSATATVTVTVDANTAPLAADDSLATTSGEGTVVVPVVDNDVEIDGEDLTVTAIDTAGTAGTVTLTGGVIDYDPSAEFAWLGHGETATDSFSYTVSDPSGSTSTARVTVTISGPNAAPTAQDDQYSLRAGQTITVEVLPNDTDPDGDDLLVTSTTGTGALLGTLTPLGAGTGRFTYDTGTAFDHLAETDSVTESFTYIAVDGLGGTTTATVTIEVAGAVPPPPAPPASPSPPAPPAPADEPDSEVTRRGSTGEPISIDLPPAPSGGEATYTVVSGQLPAGLSIDPVTGRVLGKTVEAGTWVVVIDVCDADQPTNCHEVEVTIAVAPATLAYSGSDANLMAGFGLLLFLVGVSLLGLSRGVAVRAGRRG